MNANDRIALELGRAHLNRIIAEVQLDQAHAQVAAQASEIADLKDRLGGDIEDAAVEGTGGSGPGSDPGGSSEAATG